MEHRGCGLRSGRTDSPTIADTRERRGPRLGGAYALFVSGRAHRIYSQSCNKIGRLSIQGRRIPHSPKFNAPTWPEQELSKLRNL